MPSHVSKLRAEFDAGRFFLVASGEEQGRQEEKLEGIK